MKPRNYLSLIIIFFVLNACKKEVTKPVNFTSTTYQTLAPYDSLGKPSNLLKDTISNSLLSFLDSILIKGQDLTISHPELFTATTIPDITITQQSDVYVTFVKKDCAYSNSIAFYTYPTNQPPASAKDIKLITYFFPNAGRLTALTSGDKVKIGTFTPGTSIGLVLMQNAWDTTAHTLNNNAVHFCTTDILNPEVAANLKRHAVLLNYAHENKQLIGFEDTNRTLPYPVNDNDFDDVVVYFTVTPG